MTNSTNSLNTKEVDKAVSENYSSAENAREQKINYEDYSLIKPEEVKYYKSQRIKSRTITIKLG